MQLTKTGIEQEGRQPGIRNSNARLAFVSIGRERADMCQGEIIRNDSG